MAHLTYDHYLTALRGKQSFTLLHQQAHHHLLEACATCQGQWKTDSQDASPPSQEASRPGPLDDEWHYPLQALVTSKRLLAQSRLTARRAREDLKRLLRLPLDQWVARVSGARTRFRSRAFAEVLVEESCRQVRTATHRAAALADLVPVALAWLSASETPQWARVVLARATAHRANACRVAGDLPVAEAAFTALRRELSLRPLADPEAEAEITSLEASVRIDQRHFVEAQNLLSRAAGIYRRTDDTVGLGRIFLQQAYLLRVHGDPQLVLPLLEQAGRIFNDADADSYLRFCAVHGQINVLLDLDRPKDAEDLLDASRGLYLESGDEHTSALHGFMKARIDLQNAALDRAVSGFDSTRHQFLELGRDYDAILASLYLADALLAAGNMSELHQLAGDLISLFQSRGVELETLASLRLLAQAVEAETLTAALLADLRRRLHPTASAEDLPAS